MTAHITLEFLGAAREVTGSCYLLTVGDKRLLVDCGMIQGSPEDEARNANPFPFEVNALDAVVLTHAHIDHSGRLPLLSKSGYSGPIYTHAASRDLCAIMLVDSAYLNEKECEWGNRKRQRKHLPLLEPLYTIDDARAVMKQFNGLEYDKRIEILVGVELRLRDAGHILGSAIAELWLEHNGVTRKLVFSGDLGHHGAPILRDPVAVEEADLVIMESTYGDRLHRSWDATWAELEEVITSAKNQRSNVLIPAFAVGRTQELLYAFNRNFEAWQMERWSIFLDSPMAIEATEVYIKHNNLYDKEAPSSSLAAVCVLAGALNITLNTISGGAIVISSSLAFRRAAPSGACWWMVPNRSTSGARLLMLLPTSTLLVVFPPTPMARGW